MMKTFKITAALLGVSMLFAGCSSSTGSASSTATDSEAASQTSTSASAAENTGGEAM